MRTLPRDVGSFTGRKEQLAELLDARGASAQGNIWAVDGMAGVGKTAFALHAAHHLAERFPDGQLFLELRGHVPGQAPSDPADALASLLQTLGMDARHIPQGTQERARLWRDRLAGKRLLLLLDDAADSEQVRPLLPGTAGCLVLVTSRARLTALEDTRVITLDTLSPDDAALLFTRVAARRDLAPGDPAAAEIVRLCGYLPLAVGILAARLRHHQAWTPAWLAADLAAARNGTELAATRRQLDALYDQHLISEPAPGRYLLHDLLREHARDLAETDQSAERAAAIGRLLEYYLYAARAADRYLANRVSPAAPGDGISAETPPLGDPAAGAALDGGRAPQSARGRHGRALEQPAHAIAIPAAMNAFLNGQGYWEQALELSQAAQETAKRTGDRHLQATALANLATAQRQTEDFPAAIASDQRAITLYRALGDRAGEAGALTNLGWAQYLTGDFPTADDTLSRAVELHRALGDQGGEGAALGHLGFVALTTGNTLRAVSTLSQAHELCYTVGDQTGEAQALRYLGTVQNQTGQYTEATATLTRALKIARDLGNRNDEAWTLTYMGFAQTLAGMLAPAAVTLMLAVEMFRTLGAQYGEASALSYLGLAQRVAGDLTAATASAEESLRLYRITRSQHGEANVLKEIGILQRLSGDDQAAMISQTLALNGTAMSAHCRPVVLSVSRRRRPVPWKASAGAAFAAASQIRRSRHCARHSVSTSGSDPQIPAASKHSCATGMSKHKQEIVSCDVHVVSEQNNLRHYQALLQRPLSRWASGASYGRDLPLSAISALSLPS